MGYILHTAIVVTGHDYPASVMCVPGDVPMAVTAAHAKANMLGLQPSPMTDERVNGWKSFFVPPSGSKLGWDEADRFDKARDEFVAFLRSLAYGDGSSSVHWVEVAFGGDEPGRNTVVTRGYGLRRGTPKKSA